MIIVFVQCILWYISIGESSGWPDYERVIIFIQSMLWYTELLYMGYWRESPGSLAMNGLMFLFRVYYGTLTQLSIIGERSGCPGYEWVIINCMVH